MHGNILNVHLFVNTPKFRIKRKELNDMWLLQLDDMVLEFSIFHITIIRHIN